MRDQGSHERSVYPRANREVWAALRGRDEQQHARVAATVTDDLIRRILVGEDVLDPGVCSCLYHGCKDESLEAFVCRDRWRCWRLSTRLSTPDSYGTQPCNRLHLHRV